MQYRFEIGLPNGKKISAELCEYPGDKIPPELAICLVNENDEVLQDLCIVRPHCEEPANSDTITNDVEVLVWADENDEDYTNKFVIKQYEEEEA